MNRTVTLIITSALALSLVFSALTIWSETDVLVETLYGPTRTLLMPPNSNATILLAGLSIDRSYVSFGNLFNASETFSIPANYNMQFTLSLSIWVNKSYFALLETLGYPPENTTIDDRVSDSSNWNNPLVTGEGTGFQVNMEPNVIYQLTIGNYEAFGENVTTRPTPFTIQNTSNSLQITIGDPLSIIVTYTREPNINLSGGLIILDAILVTMTIFFARNKNRSNDLQKSLQEESR